MPTAKKRINLTIEDELFNNLKKLAKKEQTSVSNVSHALLERALELREDLYFSKTSEERLNSKSRKISHEEFWN